MKDTRREFLKKFTLAAGGAAIWNALPASIQKAFAINPDDNTSFEDAEHIVLLMQENRSFDHCFGTLQGVRGFNDPRFITLPGGNPVWLQNNKKGQVFTPFRLNIKDTKITWMGGLPHSWEDQTNARNHGKHNGWLDAKKPGNKAYKDMPLTMGYYTRDDIPFYYALADAFTVCDQHFCSSLTGTTANRTFFWTGKLRASPGAQADVRNSDLYYNSEASWKTFPELLEENNIPWRIYQNEISVDSGLDDESDSWLTNFTDNNMEWFSQYHVRFYKAHYDFLKNRTGELPSEINILEQQLKTASKNQAQKISKTLTQKKEQLEKFKNELLVWSPENFDKLSSFEKNLHQKAFTTNLDDPDYRSTENFSYDDNGEQRNILLPKGDVLYQFRQDVNNGKLPVVSWLVAPQYFSDHPSAPWFGAWYISEVLDILTQNPEVWKKTIFILTYDENDGYFDHVPPFTAPKPGDEESGKVSEGTNTADDYVMLAEELSKKGLEPNDAREGPVGLGYRVPMIIASPWSRGGWINSQVFDHTSSLRFLEKFLSKKTGREIREHNISDWRRMVCGDLTSAFRPYKNEKTELPTFIKRDHFVKEIYNAKFKKEPSVMNALTAVEINEIRKNILNNTFLPQQEIGTRNSCALPYELYVNSKLSDDKKNCVVDFTASQIIFGAAALGAAFNVYAPGKYRTGNNIIEEVKLWSYSVKAGDKITAPFPLENFENNKYHLCIYGPNGFFREFSGDENDPGILIGFEYEIKKEISQNPAGNILLSFTNNDGVAYTILIEDKSYKKPTRIISLNNQQQVTESFNLENNFNWYDLSIKVKGKNNFEKRYAGRVETGEHGITDPAMGKV
ncbi:MAG: phospholipase C, phosphocholine-specific [Bacteroidetes bacterium]|nr:phospholipase C, phosphocholine-specific [Bacteroidota bacterium]